MRRAFRILSAAIAAAALACPAALAAGRVSVGLNQSVRIGVGGAAANVVVSNPNIADVTVVDAHSVIVVGKGYGATQIMVLDNSGRLLLDSIVTVAPPAEGAVTLYRGPTAKEFSCSPRCEPDTGRSGGSSPAG